MWVRTSFMLPDGYHIEKDADLLTLLRSDGSVVARFSVRGVEWSEVELAVESDARGTVQCTVPLASRLPTLVASQLHRRGE